MNEPTRTEYLPIDQIQPFENHPFQVKDDDQMDQLVWSILSQGVLTPVVVRPLDTDKYEVISGHRRLHACQKAGIAEIPALIYSLDRDTAAIALVDSNLHREHILPSEKAFAYKMKMDALSRQGKRTDLTSCQLGTKFRTDELLASDSSDSARQIQRYIRLTNLIPEILNMVDEGRIALTPAVELSYLTRQEQQELLEAMEMNDCTPSLSQACRLKKLSQENALTSEAIAAVMSETKANQKEMFRVPLERIRKYVPSGNMKQTEEFVLKACEHYQKYLLRKRERDR